MIVSDDITKELLFQFNLLLNEKGFLSCGNVFAYKTPKERSLDIDTSF